jgi:hypothetical protein
MKVRGGVALFAALSLTMVVGLLIAGAVATTRLMQRSWRVERTDVALTMQADAALSLIFANLHRLGLDDTQLGKRTALSLPVENIRGSAAVSVTRLPHGVLWMVADVLGLPGDDGHRRVNMIARFPSVLPSMSGAVVARGDIELASDVSIGLDTNTEPDCEDPRGAVVVAAPGARVSFRDSAAVVTSVGANDSAAYLLTALQLAALHRSGRFDHVLGDTAIAGGAFDGVLVVEGSLTITGPFTATGLIVARGPIMATGPVTITGSVRSFSQPGIGKLAIKFSGAVIRYSRCAVDRALRRALDARVVSQRSWAELF